MCLEIDRKLRDDFRRRVKDFGVSSDTTDPMLAVLFRTVAQQIDQVYSDTDRLRQSMLHELMVGLQVQQYLATPAQAAVRLLNDLKEPRVLRAGTELNAVAPSGERLSFGLDATCEISQARIAFALSLPGPDHAPAERRGDERRHHGVAPFAGCRSRRTWAATCAVPRD